MRRPIIAGNWKMNLKLDEAKELANAIAYRAPEYTGDVDVVLGPTAVCLHSVSRAVKGSDVGVAAQNMHTAPKGAFTGELGAPMLLDAGCTHVIIGHSERRQFFGESNEGVNHKTRVALQAGLTPIVCIGESLKEREAERTMSKVRFQVTAALQGLTPEQVTRVVLAYEPIWAIGTGLTASPEQAQEVHAQIRELIATLHDQEVAGQVRIQYGGSVKPSNAAELLAQPDIDGALVGGASLKADSFMGIIEAAASTRG